MTSEINFFWLIWLTLIGRVKTYVLWLSSCKGKMDNMHLCFSIKKLETCFWYDMHKSNLISFFWSWAWNLRWTTVASLPSLCRIINPNLVCHFGVKRFYDKLLGILNFDTPSSMNFIYLHIWQLFQSNDKKLFDIN